MDVSSMPPRARAEAFFNVLDDNDTAAIPELVAREFVYEFGDTTIRGRENMIEYLSTGRSIRDTTHELEQVVVDEDICVVEGSVDGRTPNGDPIQSDFIDVFEFDPSSRVIERVGVYTR